MKAVLTIVGLTLVLGLSACATRAPTRDLTNTAGCDVPMRPLKQTTAVEEVAVPRTPFGWAFALKRHCPDWYVAAGRSRINAMPWPAGFDPAKNPVFAYNEVFIPNVSPARVFALLRDARKWPRFYPNSDAIEIEGKQTLEAGARFRWTTFATRQQSEVVVFEPDRALGWTAESLGTHALHRWILQAKDGGTLLITEECQYGFVAALDRAIMNPALHAAHQLWLERIRQQLTIP